MLSSPIAAPSPPSHVDSRGESLHRPSDHGHPRHSFSIHVPEGLVGRGGRDICVHAQSDRERPSPSTGSWSHTAIVRTRSSSAAMRGGIRPAALRTLQITLGRAEPARQPRIAGRGRPPCEATEQSSGRGDIAGSRRPIPCARTAQYPPLDVASAWPNHRSNTKFLDWNDPSASRRHRAEKRVQAPLQSVYSAPSLLPRTLLAPCAPSLFPSRPCSSRRHY
jgi:hypothetical protein